MPSMTIYQTADLSDPGSLEVFLGDNELEHVAVDRALRELGKLVQEIPLNGSPLDQNGSWLSDHDDRHHAEALALGFSAPDLSDVDFRNQQSLDDWVYSHSKAHEALRLALRL